MSESALIFEFEARQRKVAKLVELFKSKGATSSDLTRLDSVGWNVAAQLLGTRSPSEKTRASVIEALKAAENAKNKYADNPFVAFPTGAAQ